MPKIPLHPELAEPIQGFVNAGLYPKDSCIGHERGEKRMYITFIVPESPSERLRTFDWLYRVLPIYDMSLTSAGANEITLGLTYTKKATLLQAMEALCAILPGHRED